MMGENQRANLSSDWSPRQITAWMSFLIRLFDGTKTQRGGWGPGVSVGMIT
jgi:hypothetical protein